MFNEEEFNSIAFAYRAWPESDPQGVVDRYNELLAYVEKHTSTDPDIASTIRKRRRD